ncbi:alpha/beta hydrolase [Chloropicon primus]|uniref:Alpha/beta hydrolase n=2 Tax=Chloropicon primus TaxID=1764295 RepID=A0A5B8MTS7_9CHLO|nr:alpha/beta hydrolase [Chloropicon primus]UPR03396.1 alpha/beta hydrolase [Chloropicon primus]|eukprot:QDZ24188.1 alpha/beta hydrolase [Chloropicon primus]
MAGRSATAGEPAGVLSTESIAVEADLCDYGDLHVTSGTHKEGLYFKVGSSLARGFISATEAVRKRSKFLRTPWWAKNGHVNTLVGHMLRGTRGHPGEGYDRMLLRTDDGGTLSIDVTKAAGVGEKGVGGATEEPFVLMIAGLGGSSADPYTQAMTSACARRGWKSAVICMRGTGQGPVTSGRLFSARRGSTDDVRFVMRELKTKGVIEEDQPIFGIGWSLGGCIMSNTVLEQDELDPPLRIEAAAALGAPYDLHESSELLKPFPNKIYSSRMAQGLVNILKPVAHVFDGVHKNYLGEENSFEFNGDKCYECKSILEFDEALTAPFFGFKSAKDYYDFSSPGRRFSESSPSVPTILVSALDDPVVGNVGIPFEAARKNENVVVVATDSGGHLGWCQSTHLGCGFAKNTQETSWTEDLVMDFFHQALQQRQAKTGDAASSKAEAVASFPV